MTNEQIKEAKEMLITLEMEEIAMSEKGFNYSADQIRQEIERLKELLK